MWLKEADNCRLRLTLLSTVCAAALAGVVLSGAGSGRRPSATTMLGVRKVSPRDWLSAQTQFDEGGKGRALKLGTAPSKALSYAGIVPYTSDRSRGHPRAVICGGGASVGCVLSTAEDGLHSAMAGDKEAGPGKLAVEQAARGKGFAPWHVSHQTKAARVNAQHTVAASSGHGHGPYSLRPGTHTAGSDRRALPQAQRPQFCRAEPTVPGLCRTRMA